MTPLRQRMLEDMQVRNLAAKAQHTYIVKGALIESSASPALAQRERANQTAAA